MATCDPINSLGMPKYERTQQQPENPFVALVPDQQIAIIPFFTLESGVVLKNVPVAYTTRGSLSPNADNCMVICHALTGSADVSDWWGPLIGPPGHAFDTSRFFVVCMNSLGSPYGSASPVTCKDGDPTRERYGPEFPLTTIRDDINLHKLLLDDLGVRQIAAVIGGSLGGMFVLEWAYLGKDYVRCIVPIATSSRHSAWGISWGEAQRQSIYADPKYDDGYYQFSDQPSTGLGAARMAALLTYRSRNSFESRFGRNTPDPSKRQWIRERPPPSSVEEAHFHIHNDGHKVKCASPRGSISRHNSNASEISQLAQQHQTISSPTTNVNSTNGNSNGDTGLDDMMLDPQFHGPKKDVLAAAVAVAKVSGVRGAGRGVGTGAAGASGGVTSADKMPTSTYFSAQSYLRYQGDKFVKRFDSNCYIAMTRKLDTHDVSRGRADTIADGLAILEQPTLVLGIESDGLFTFAEQQELAAHIKNARLERIESPEGHDAFLLQFEQVNKHILEFLREVLPDIMNTEGTAIREEVSVGQMTKTSTFGEAEVGDLTAW